MTSKNLYWAKWKENVKRRNWTFLLCLAVLLLAFPACLLIMLTSYSGQLARNAAGGASAEQLEEIRLSMLISYEQWTGCSMLFAALAAVFAVLFAVQGFSWLYSRNKLDMYMSVPVSGKKRFVLIWANGILGFAAPYLFSLLLSWLIGGGFGLLSVTGLFHSLMAFVVNMLCYLALYHLALVAVMLTGNVLTALLGCVVLFVYEPLARMLVSVMNGTFFKSYSYIMDTAFLERRYLTPLASYGQFTEDVVYRGGSVTGPNASNSWCALWAKECLVLLLAAALLGLLVYVLFRKRKTESHGRSIAVGWAKPVLEILLLVPFSVAVGLITARYSQNYGVFLFAALIVGALAGHAILRLIYEKDLKEILRGKIPFVLSAALAVFVVCVYRFDLTGFDSFLPQKEDVESVSVSLESDYIGFGRYNLPVSEDSYRDRDVSKLILDNMDSTDPETIDAVLTAAKAWQDAGALDRSDYASVTAGLALKGWSDEEFSTGRYWIIKYTLKGGKEVYRRVFLSGLVTPGVLDAVMKDEAFQNCRYQIYEDAFEQELSKMKITYNDGVREYLVTADAKEVLEGIRTDMRGYDYSLVSGKENCGVLSFEIESPLGRRYSPLLWEYPVYDSFTDTIGLLCENGIPAGEKETLLPAQEVTEIAVRYYYYPEMENPILEDTGAEEQEIYVIFDQEEEIEEILKVLRSGVLDNAVDQSIRYIERESGFQSVLLTLSAEGAKKQYSIGDLYFREGTVPEFVVEKLKAAMVQ